MGLRGWCPLLSVLVGLVAPVSYAQGGGALEARGEAIYRIPIVVPPGPAGHAPELELVYSSGEGRGPSGWLGLGWSLSGESRIERETRTASPWDFEEMSCGEGGVFACYRTDYVLDGQDLICSSGACRACTASSPCRYRTQSDDGRVIEFRGDASGWQIADRDGRVSVYGADSSGAGRLVNDSSAPGEVFSWQLERTADVSGNEIRYVYDTTSSPGIAYLDRIEYGQGATANRSIDFVLNDPVNEPRADKPVRTRAGFRQQVERRVVSIEVRASNELVTSYALGYTQDPDSLRSRLSTVQRIGSDSLTSLPAYTFDYSERAPGDGFAQTNEPGFFGSATQCPPLGGLHADPSGNGFWNIADLNRDGLDDLYFVQGYSAIQTAGRTEVALGTGTRFLPGAGLACGFELARGSLWSIDRLFFASTSSLPTLQISGAATLDLDGDGFLDHVDRNGSYAAGSFDPVPVGLRLGSSSGFAEATLPTSLALPHEWDFDFGNAWNADDFWIRIATTENGVFDTRALLADVTGDGRPDLLATRGTTGFHYSDGFSSSPIWNAWTGWAVFANRGLKTDAGFGPFLDFGSEPILWPAAPGTTIERIGWGITSVALADQNGDGLPDRLTPDSVAYGYGAGFLPAENVANGLTASLVVAPQYVEAGLYDLNGDGLLDHVAAQHGPSDPYWHVHFGTGHGFNPSESLFRRVVDWLDERAIEADGLVVGSRSIRDVNGDGRLDYVAAGRRSVFLQDGVANHDGARTEPLAGLLTRAVDPLGGTVEFSYATSPQFRTAGGMPANPEMALRRPVVTRVAYRDGRANTPAIVSEFRYANGVFDFAEKEFRGFGTVVETRVESDADVSRITSSYRTDRTCAFRLASREVASGVSVLERESMSWVEVVGGGESVARQWGRCLASARVVEAIEGDELAMRVRRTSWNYGDPIDASYNVARIEEWGEWNPATNQDVPGDERITEFSYAPASDARPSIVSRPSLEVVVDRAGNVHSKRRYCYAGANACDSAGNGLLAVVTAYLTDYLASPPIIDVPKTIATIVHDEFGNPTQVTGASTPDDPDGLRTRVVYDDTYRTFPSEIRRGADVALPLRPLVTSFAYTGCEGGLAPPPGLGRPCSVVEPEGQIEQLGYDVFGRVKRVDRPASGYLATWSYTFPGPSAPGENAVEMRIHRSGDSDLVGRTHLDGLSRVYREESAGKQTESVSIDRTYDDRGRLRTESLPHSGGAVSSRVFSWDALGRPKLVLDPDATTRHAWSYAPWTTIEETYFGPPSAGDRVERTERMSDGLGRWVRVASHPDAVTLSDPHVVSAKYDAADRLYEVRDPIANDPSLCASLEMGPACAAQDHVTEIFWDTLGRRVRIDDPDSGIWRFDHDDAGRLVARVQNAGTSEARSERRSYDPLGRLRAKSFSPAGMGVANASFVYGTDASLSSFGQLIGVMAAEPSSTSYLYGYDEAGRRSSVVQRTDGLEFESSWEYDALDRVKRRVFPDGDAFEFAYDGVRLREIRADPANPAFTGVVVRDADYDALGRITSLEIGQRAGGAALAVQTYGYDPTSARLSRVRATPGNLLSDDPDADRVATSSDVCPNAYDPDQLDRGGLGDASGPDGIGDGCQCGDVDGSGRVTLADGFAILMHDFGDDPLVREDLCDVDGGGSCDPYDFVAVLTALWHGVGDLQRCRATTPSNLPSSAPIDLDLVFDGLGRLVTQSGVIGAEPVNRSYGYDGLSRLVTATGSWEKARDAAEPVTWTYRYDALGNLRRQVSSRPESFGGDHRTWGYFHASKPRVLTEFVEAGEQWEAIGSTLGGEVAQIDFGSGYGRDTLIWNTQGKLHRHRRSTYGYDVFGDLTLTSTGPSGAATSIVSVGGDFEYDVGAQRANKHFSIGGVRVASLATTPVTPGPTSGPGRFGRHAEPILAHLTDHLGAIRASVNRDGIVVETRDYAPFGESIAHAGAYSVAHRFTGQPQDDEAGGLYDYGARFYDARWNRFISPDEVVQDFDAPGLNPYSYVQNRPTSATDPTGMLIWNGVSYGAWSTATLQSGVLQTTPEPSAETPFIFGFAPGPAVGVTRVPAPGGIRKLPRVVASLGKVILTDLQAATLAIYSQLVIHPFMSLGMLIDRSVNGDVSGMGEAAGRLIRGTLVPRYGLQNGVFWGRGQTSNERLESVLDEAGFEHDGLCAGGCDNAADRTWIRIAWSDPFKLGPYGQAYRVVGTAAFGARIAWRSMTGQP